MRFDAEWVEARADGTHIHSMVQVCTSRRFEAPSFKCPAHCSSRNVLWMRNSSWIMLACWQASALNKRATMQTICIPRGIFIRMFEAIQAVVLKVAFRVPRIGRRKSLAYMQAFGRPRLQVRKFESSKVITGYTLHTRWITWVPESPTA